MGERDHVETVCVIEDPYYHEAFVINVRASFHFQDGIVMRKGGAERGEYYRERLVRRTVPVVTGGRV